ncbi:MAG: Mut7-C RNAse domain-containing protein [Candidatus Thermoplasmatota archaeon]|nr:Mut7-C RNAse domain-containing protein [Candidatus Thermoplasmatota archaeon]
MLGTLAKWLRLLGFDTFYADQKMDDRELIEIAKKEKRIVITRDKQLFKMVEKENLQLVKMTSIKLDEQVQQIIQKSGLNENTVLSRCSICNSILREVEKNDVDGEVPENAFNNNECFWFCPQCKKVYWCGSHWDMMQKKVMKLKKMIE